MAELADALDSKSSVGYTTCGFESLLRQSVTESSEVKHEGIGNPPRRIYGEGTADGKHRASRATVPSRPPTSCASASPLLLPYWHFAPRTSHFLGSPVPSASIGLWSSKFKVQGRESKAPESARSTIAARPVRLGVLQGPRCRIQIHFRRGRQRRKARKVGPNVRISPRALRLGEALRENLSAVFFLGKKSGPVRTGPTFDVDSTELVTGRGQTR